MDDFEVEVVGGEQETVETPSSVEETPSEETTEQGEESTTEEAPQTDLYELPDGRKVPADQVLEEYKNLQKDYTQKAQKLASYEKTDINNKKDDVDYKNPEWQPQTYGELIELAKQEIYKDFEARQQAEQEYEQQLATQVDTQISEVKKLDPNVDENKLLEHATKYSIPNLISAYQNMKEMNARVEAVRNETVKNIQKRAADPVAGGAGQETPIDDSDVYYPSISTRSMIDYLRQIKKK